MEQKREGNQTKQIKTSLTFIPWCPIPILLEFLSSFEPPKVASMARLLRNTSLLTRSLFVPKVRSYAPFLSYDMILFILFDHLFLIIFCHQKTCYSVLSFLLFYALFLFYGFWWSCLSRFNFFCYLCTFKVIRAFMGTQVRWILPSNKR